MFKKYTGIILVIALVLGMSSLVLAVDIPQGQLPIFLTSAGQSPDDFMVRSLLTRQGVEIQHDPLVEPEDIGEVGTLMFAIGGSAKGLGDAGIDEFEETERLEAILSAIEARRDGGEEILILGIHIGGEGRKGPISQRFIDILSPRADLLVVWEEGNRDGMFTSISDKHDIPLVILDNVMELSEVFQEMFN